MTNATLLLKSAAPRFATYALVTMISASTIPAISQTPSQNLWGYNFPRSYDAEIAAPDVHRVRYADDHIMLMEVANPPGYPMQMHGHPYPSIFARSSGRTNIGGGPGDGYLEPDGGRNGEHWHSAPSPAGSPSLECTAADPQAPHRPVNHGVAPQHFYRIEFKRIDDDDPANVADLHRRSGIRKLYEDDVVRLLDVVISPAHGATRVHPAYPAVLAFDTNSAFGAVDAVIGSAAGRSAPPTGMSMPRCMTIDAGNPVPLRNAGTVPLHYYRLDFKRIEGADLKDHWREWYPWMSRMH